MCRVSSVKFRVWSVKCTRGVSGVEIGVQSVECGLSSVGCGVRGVKYNA